jgi:hypothetical protein
MQYSPVWLLSERACSFAWQAPWSVGCEWRIAGPVNGPPEAGSSRPILPSTPKATLLQARPAVFLQGNAVAEVASAPGMMARRC